MLSKAVLVFCAQALLVQSALSQCTSRAGVVARPEPIGPLDLAAPYGFAAPYGLTASGLEAPYGLAGAALASPYGIAGPIGLAAPSLPSPYGLATSGLAAPYGIASPFGFAAPGLDFTPTSGGGLPISSGSNIAPVGISVTSENAYEGILETVGKLPFVGTVGIEGVLPTAGAGVVNHSCGNGVNAMASGDAAFTPTYAGAIAPGLSAPALGYAAGWAGRGCGYAL